MSRRHDPGLVALLQNAVREASFPETPALAERVRTRIERGPRPIAPVQLPRTRPPLLRPALAAALAVAVAGTVTLSVSVTARRAVADLLGVVGIRVTFGDDPPASPRPARDIRFGERVSEAAASERAGFHVSIPAAVAAEPALYLDRSIGERGMVSVVYPRGAETLADVDLLVSQFVASIPEEYVKKLLSMGSDITYTDADGAPAFWISGEPHFFYYEERNGEVRRERVRLAGDVLIWEERGVTYRVEGARSLEDARRIAASLR